MKNLVRFFIDRPLLVNLITVGVCVAGAIVMGLTTRALLPDIKPRTVTVTADLPGASALDTERFVTFRLEEALSGMSDVEKVESETTNGRSVIRVTGEPGIESASLLSEEIRSRLSSIRYRLPDDLRPLRIETPRVGNDYLMAVNITGIDHGNEAHREAVRMLQERLSRVPNVTEATSSLRPQELHVRFSRTALEAKSLDVGIARARLLEHLQHQPLGRVRVEDQDVAIELHQDFSLDSVRELPLRMNRAGLGVRLEDVATVGFALAEQRTRHSLDGSEDWVELRVVNAWGTDVVDVSHAIRKILKEEGAAILPKGSAWHMETDASEVIEHELGTLTSNGLSGIVIVLVILAMFLGWRVSLMTAIGLPFSYLGLVLVLQYFDVNFNLISLVAMILVIGILVDDAIIVAEEYCQELPKAKSPQEAAMAAVGRVAKPILGMVATTTVAFVPLLLLEHEVTWILRPLPIVVIAALFLSLFESFFLLPNHLAHFIRSDKAGMRKISEGGRVLHWCKAVYRKVLGWGLRLRYALVLVFAALIGLTAVLLQGPVKLEDNLDLNSMAVLVVELDEPAHTLDALATSVSPVEKFVSSLEKGTLAHWRTELGAAPRSGTSWRYATFRLIPPGTFVEQEEAGRRLRKEIGEEIRSFAGKDGIRDIRFAKDKSAQEHDLVTVHVSGGDRVSFTDIQDDIRNTLTEIEGVSSVYMDESRLQRSFRFNADDAKLLAYGLDISALRRQLREHFRGQELARIRAEGEEIEVYLGFDSADAETLENLADLSVMSPSGVAVPVAFFGTWEEVEVLRKIEHRDLLRLFKIDVHYDKEMIDENEVSERVEEKLAPLRDKYKGYHVSVKPSESAENTERWIWSIALLCLGLIYLSLALSLGSLVHPILVIFAIPFGFIGVVLALFAHGMPLGIMAAIGVLGLAGVVVNDSLVMTTTITDVFNGDRAAGMRAAILEGAPKRFRAVVLTSLTTLGGVFPLAYGFAGDAGWIQPMIFAVGWGLLFATWLTLFFLPAFLLIIDDQRRWMSWLWSKITRFAF